MSKRERTEDAHTQYEQGVKHAEQYHKLRDTDAAPKLRAKFDAALRAYKADGGKREYLAGWLDVMGRRVRLSATKEA